MKIFGLEKPSKSGSGAAGIIFRWILFLKGIDREVLVGVERTIYIPPNETIFYNNINYIVEICLCATKLFAMKMELKLEHKKNISKIDLCYKILEVTRETLADTHIPTHSDLYITFLRDSHIGINLMSVSQKIFPRSNSLCL